MIKPLFLPLFMLLAGLSANGQDLRPYSNKQGCAPFYLQSDEADQAKVNAAYAQLDVNGQTIPNLTDHPVCLVAEQSLGHTAAGKAEENTINALLNQGSDNIFSIVHALSNTYFLIK